MRRHASSPRLRCPNPPARCVQSGGRQSPGLSRCHRARCAGGGRYVLGSLGAVMPVLPTSVGAPALHWPEAIPCDGSKSAQRRTPQRRQKPPPKCGAPSPLRKRAWAGRRQAQIASQPSSPRPARRIRRSVGGGHADFGPASGPGCRTSTAGSRPALRQSPLSRLPAAAV